MPRAPKRRAKTNLCQCKSKHQARLNEHWLNLSSRKTDLQITLQVTLTTILTFIAAMTQQLLLVLAVEAVADADNIDYDAVAAAVDSIAIVLMNFLGLLHAIQVADAILFDIPLKQEEAPPQFTRRKGLRIDDLSDTAALKMTRFNWGQLRRLYVAFNLGGQLEPMQDKLFYPTGHVYNGTPCYYRIHPEEVFLNTLYRLATGLAQVQIMDMYIGGNTNRWTYAYSWMLNYLDQRYINIVGHQGLTYFIDDFPSFRCVIQQYVQCNHRRKLIDGTMTIVPGNNFMPWDVFGFIDDSID
jgi:hypothetical protein